MRYEDWDVLLFPRESKNPFKEFKVACHVVNDQEPSQLGGNLGLPTVCCFVPSLPPGSLFQVSIHSWNTPIASDFAKSYTRYPELLKFEARLFIDGRLVAYDESTTLDAHSTWPHIIALAWDSSAANPGPLKFPCFRRELLQQDWWLPTDDLGRIKVVLSEGFLRDSSSTPFERIKNVVAFSFQHAPLGLLEASSIAWPNPSMWCKAPHAATVEVPTIQSDDFESHGHSPLRHRGALRNDRLITSALKGGSYNPATLAATNRCVTHPLASSLPPIRQSSYDPFFGHSSSYGEWLDSMGAHRTSSLFKNKARNSIPSRSTRKSNTDVSMPDYVSSHAEDDNVPEEKLDAHLKAPANSPGMGGFGLCDKELGAEFPIIAYNSPFPADESDSLTDSLLNQPIPNYLHGRALHVPSAAVRSRKENLDRPFAGLLSTPTSNRNRQDGRQVSHQMHVTSISSNPVCNVDTKTTSPALQMTAELGEDRPRGCAV